MTRIFLLLCFSSLANAGIDEDLAFVRALRARLTEGDCPVQLVNLAGQNVAAMADPHLLDLARVEGGDLAEAERIVRASVQDGQRTGGREYPLVLGYGDHFVRPFRAELARVLREAEPSPEPLYLALVGTGDGNEFSVVARLVDEELRKNGTDAARIDLRFGIYDVTADALRRADSEYANLVLSYPWLKDRVDVRFFDMTVVDFAFLWGNRRLGLVMARNSIRRYIVDNGWPLMMLAALQLVPGGLVVVDGEAHARLVGLLSSFNKVPAKVKGFVPNFATIFDDLGAFGPNSEEESFLLRRNASPLSERRY